MSVTTCSASHASTSPDARPIRLRPGFQRSQSCTQANTLPNTFRVPLDSLRPTQVAVGMRAVAFKRAKVEQRVRKRRAIERFLDQRPIPSVLGPGGRLFMIDHHHLGLALWQAEVDQAVVQIVDDLSTLSAPRFWCRMEEEGRLYPFDEEGRRIQPSRLPTRLGKLREDPYRDLAWSVREAGGFLKSPRPYAEFGWAEFFREHIAERTIKKRYDVAVERAVRLARSTAAERLPGYLGA